MHGTIYRGRSTIGYLQYIMAGGTLPTHDISFRQTVVSTAERADVMTPRGRGLNGRACERKTLQRRGGSTTEQRRGLNDGACERKDAARRRKTLNGGACRHITTPWSAQRRNDEDVTSVIHDGINTQKADGLYIHSGMQLGSSRRDEMRRVPYPQRGAIKSDTQDERRRGLSIVGLAIRSPRKMGAVSAARCAGIEHARRDKKGADHGGTGDMIAAQDEMGAVSAAGCAGIEQARKSAKGRRKAYNVRGAARMRECSGAQATYGMQTQGMNHYTAGDVKGIGKEERTTRCHHAPRCGQRIVKETCPSQETMGKEPRQRKGEQMSHCERRKMPHQPERNASPAPGG
ncbi:hypothetical protein DFH06DRAFT_1434596 [Mycena polygramma]|nr:hypothetical protein DFH06DRAFT_1434596 [Mycena polygramma]